MTTPHNSAQLITRMRSLAKSLFVTGVEALPPTGSSAVFLHPRMARLACINAVADIAFRHVHSVLVPGATSADDEQILTLELLTLAESAAKTEGSVAVVLGRTERGPCNKRLALRFALAAETSRLRRPWIFLSGRTGYHQCRYHSAGAIVDGGTCSWIWPIGAKVSRLPIDPAPLLAASGDLLITDVSASAAVNLDLIILA